MLMRLSLLRTIQVKKDMQEYISAQREMATVSPGIIMHNIFNKEASEEKKRPVPSRASKSRES